MFKTKYAAVCEHIAPTPAVCEQVLAAMHAEEAAHIPTIVPIKKNTSNVRFWMPLVACAAVALIAVTLGLTLREGDPLPVAPVSPTTSTVPTTSTTENAPTTTVADEAIASTDNTTSATASDTSNVVTSTTPTTKAPSSTEETAPSTSGVPVLTPETYPSAAVSDYYALYQAIVSLNTTTIATGNTTTSTASTTAKVPADSTMPSNTASESTTTVPLLPPTAIATTANATTAAPMAAKPTTTMAPAPSLPQLGEEAAQEERVDPIVQTTDRLIGHLKGNTVQLAPLDSGNATVLSSTQLAAPSGTRVRGFYLYNSRMAVIYAPHSNAADPVTYIQLFDISNPAAPRQVHTLGQSGEFLSAHAAGGALYISTYHTPTGTPDPNDPATFVPLLYKNGAASVMPVHRITIAEHANYKGYTVVTATALTGVDAYLSTAALFGQQNSHVFSCDSGIVVLSDEVAPDTQTDMADPDDNYYRVIQYRGVYATLFSCQNGRVTIAKTAQLRGATDVPAVFKEQNGYYYFFLKRSFRRQVYIDGKMANDELVSTGYEFYVFDAQFQLVRHLPSLWQLPMKILSAHFTETKFFVITHDNILSIDLSDPAFASRAIDITHDLSITALQSIDSEHLLTVSRGRYAKNDPFALTIRDQQWNVLYELIPEGTTSPLFAPRDGFILYADRICTYDAGGIYELPIRFQNGEALVDCFTTDHTLYLVRKNGITAYDRRNNYSLIGTF